MRSSSALTAFLFAFFLGVTAPGNAQTKQIDLINLLGEARDLGTSGKPAEAIKLLEELLTKIPKSNERETYNHAFLLNEISVLKRATGQSHEALEDVLRAENILVRSASENELLVAVILNSAEALSLLGESEKANGRFHRAVVLAEKLEIDSLITHSRIRFAGTSLELGSWKKAVAAVEPLEHLSKPQATQVATILGQAYLTLRLPKQARTSIDALEQVDRNDPHFALINARIDLQLGNVQESLDKLTALLEEMDESQTALLASARYNLSEAYFQMGLLQEAYANNEHAMLIAEESLRKNETLVGQTLHRRAMFLGLIGDIENSIKGFEVAASVFTEKNSRSRRAKFYTKLELSRALSSNNRKVEALTLARKLIPEAPIIFGEEAIENMFALTNLGSLLIEVRELEEAKSLLRNSQMFAVEGRFSKPDLAPTMVSLGKAYMYDGMLEEAESVFLEVLQDYKEFGAGESVEKAGEIRRLLSEIYYSRNDIGDIEKAVHLSRINIAGIKQRIKEVAKSTTYARQFSSSSIDLQIGNTLTVLNEYQRKGFASNEEMFEAAQLTLLNEAATATNGFLRHFKANDPKLAELFAERQAASAQIRALTIQPDQQKQKVLDQVKRLIQDIDSQILYTNPDLLAYLSPSVITTNAIQTLLDQDEALWTNFSFEGGTFIFLVTKDEVFVESTNANIEQVDQLVRKLRENMDLEGRSTPPPFDFESSTRLYNILFEPFDRVLQKKKKLLVVPQGPAQQISLAVATRSVAPIGKTPKNADARFLGLTHSITVYTSAANLLFSKLNPSNDVELKSITGFANPSFSNRSLDTGDLSRDIEINPKALRLGSTVNYFEPLPETERELDLISRSLPGSSATYYTGKDASEEVFKLHEIKGDVLVFATHAIVSGQFGNLREPALVLSSPAETSGIDDGFLTASEIAQKQIAAKIVVLSACNTASASGQFGAPGLSGLAQGFFEAGAQSLVVSHWTISTVSPLLLMPSFFEGISSGLAPDEAMREAMIEVSTREDLKALGHPAIWAPFSIVGNY
ncbi:CHAT domain-containing protein [Ruegeria conchae]|uniref:CHAT domain-containing protein n=1 Tax=Ruegeria conchae TaxID=981384 RepID=UPI0021A62452|nr:CHAT domain-containing protein [Ruegeria conchae]UWR03636.1 CHAT domain-containing protein [Ruegeria conchae]